MLYLIPIIVVAIVTFGLYKVFVRLSNRLERRVLMSKLEGQELVDCLKSLSVEPEKCTPEHRSASSIVSSVIFKAGCLLAGLGLGLFVAYYLIVVVVVSLKFEELLLGGSLLFFGGLSLVVSFVIEHILYNKNQVRMRKSENK